MTRPHIVLGDKTSHGGSVISADLTTDINGKYMARVGDKTVCPRCKGIFAITTGAEDVKDGDGRAYARNGDSTACGATLISAQVTTFWGPESSMGDPTASAKDEALSQAAKIAAPTTSGVCLECLLSAATTGSSTVIRD